MMSGIPSRCDGARPVSGDHIVILVVIKHIRWTGRVVQVLGPLVRMPPNDGCTGRQVHP